MPPHKSARDQTSALASFLEPRLSLYGFSKVKSRLSNFCHGSLRKSLTAIVCSNLLHLGLWSTRRSPAGGTSAERNESQEWAKLHRRHDFSTQAWADVPPGLDRILGLGIGDQVLPAMVLSKPMAELLQWAWRQNRKTRRILYYFMREIEAIEAQDTGWFNQQRERERKMRDLHEILFNNERTADHHAAGEQFDVLNEEHRSVEEHRKKWNELKEEMKIIRNNEAVMHANRIIQAMIPVQDYFENSGLPDLRLEEYLEEVRDAIPEMRKYYDGVRGLLAKQKWPGVIRRLHELDEENVTMPGDVPRREVPEELQHLAAEYDLRKHEFELVQAEFNDRKNTNNENKFRWDEAGALGNIRPSKEEFDQQCLREDIRKTRNLRRAEAALTDVRLRLSEYIPMSDVNSDVVPLHETPRKGFMHTAAIRAAQSSDRIKKWQEEHDCEDFGPGPDNNVDMMSWDMRTLRPEDSFSIVEQDAFLIARTRGWEKLQATRRPEPQPLVGPGSTGGGSPGKRRRSSSAGTRITAASRTNGRNRSGCV